MPRDRRFTFMRTRRLSSWPMTQPTVPLPLPSPFMTERDPDRPAVAIKNDNQRPKEGYRRHGCSPSRYGAKAIGHQNFGSAEDLR
jgi:hypothetical protein